ncbi:ERO1-like protein alpha, partial [Frankliniella fusca]
KSELFAEVDTKSKRKSYFKKKFDAVHPKHIPVQAEFVSKGSGEKKKIEIVEKTAHHPEYNKLCSDYVIEDDEEVIDSYLKSECAKRNQILQAHPDACRIVLYYDDAEVCDPIGSASGRHKLGMFYIFLENVGPCHRQRLELISLLLVVDSALLKCETGGGLGIDLILEEIVDDLKKLENGVTLQNGKILYATVIACIGDNLGCHTVAGLKEGFTAHRPCRFCMVTEVQRMALVREDPKLLRTDEEWLDQVRQIQKARTKKEKEALMKEYGIKRLTPFSGLSSFSVSCGFAPDILHDIIENGVLSIELRLILIHVLKKYDDLSLFMINERIKYFDYGHAEKLDKPGEIKKEHLEEDGHLRQTASQMWQLATILPFVVASFVSLDDEHWDNFMLLLEISRMVFS